MMFIKELFEVGGIFVYGILGTLIAVLYVGATKLKQLYVGQVNGNKLKEILDESIVQKKFDEVLMFSKNYPKSPLAKIVEAGVSRFGRDESHIEHAISATLNEEVPKLQSGVATISFLANIATLFGLLGTITGMISAFKGISDASAAAKQTLLASGISEAMHCTASGLFVAVLALLIASVVNSRVNKMTADCNTLADKCLEASGARLYSNNKNANVVSRHVGAA